MTNIFPLNKKFTQSIIILLFLNLLVKPFWIFVVDRTIQNKVGADEYGLYFSLFSFSLLFNMFSDLGITNYNNRYLAQNRHQLKSQLGLIIPVKLVLSAIYCIVTLVAGLYIGYSERQFILLIWLIINQLIISFILYLRSNISALQLFNLDSIISVIDKTLMIIISSVLLWGNFGFVFKIEWLVYTQTISYIITLFVALYLVINKSGIPVFWIKRTTIIHTLKLSFPFALLAFLMASYTRIDAVMIERILVNGNAEAGIYAQAFRITDALSMFAFMFASILLPLFAKMMKDKEPINITLSHSFAMLMIPASGFLIALIFTNTEFMRALYNSHSEQSSEILLFLLIGFGGICLSYIFGTLLTAAGKLKILNQIAFAGLATNIILNTLLIPIFAAKGAAIASMITQLSMGIIQAIASIRILKISIKINTLVRYGLYTFFLFILTSISSVLKIPWYVILIFMPLSGIFISMGLKLLKIENFRKLFW